MDKNWLGAAAAAHQAKFPVYVQELDTMLSLIITIIELFY